jgi:glycerophosphoryl diester phosphodiesterase
VVQSFDPDVLERIQEIDPDLGVCPLYGLWKVDVRRPRPSEASVLCLMAEMGVLNPWMIRQAHAQGREVSVWSGVIEHPVVRRLLLALGADGLMVDNPVASARASGR